MLIEHTHACRRCCTDASTCGQYSTSMCVRMGLFHQPSMSKFILSRVVNVGGRHLDRAWLSIKMPASGRKTRSLEEQVAKLKEKVRVPTALSNTRGGARRLGVDGMRRGQAIVTVLACLRPGGPSRPHDLTPGAPCRRMRTARRT